MNILIVSVRGPTNASRRGGAQDYIQNIASPWTRLGHRVEILCAQESFNGGLLPAEEQVEGLHVYRVGSPRQRVLPLLKAVKHRAADIVIENIMGFPILLPPVLKSSVPLIAIKHHFEGAAFLRGHGLLKGLWGIFLEQWVQPVFYHGAQLVAVSQKTRKEFESQWPRPNLPVAIVPPGIAPVGDVSDDQRFDEPTVIYFGALDTKRKRVDHLIEAFRMVLQQCPTARLIIGGGGPDRSQLEKMAAGLPIKFTGFLSEDEKADLLRGAWLFASPSMTEGFGITWVEANAYGIPVVGYELGLDTVDDSCARMVQKGDVQSLATEISALLIDKQLRLQLGSGARKNAQRFSWVKSSELFMRVIEQVSER